MSSMSPAIACFIDLQDQVLASSCPFEMVVLSERSGRVSCACPPRHGQKKAAFAACEGLRSPRTEQVLLMLKATIPPVLCHDHGWIQILRGRNLNYLRSLHKKEHECSMRYGPLEGALRIKLR